MGLGSGLGLELLTLTLIYQGKITGGLASGLVAVLLVVRQAVEVRTEGAAGKRAQRHRTDLVRVRVGVGVRVRVRVRVRVSAAAPKSEPGPISTVESP